MSPSEEPMAGAGFNEFHAELTAHDDAQWLDPDAALPIESLHPISDVTPRAGTERLVRVGDNSRPFAVGQERWIVFVPALGAINGWNDYPETLPESAFVQCRINAIERVDATRPHRSWLRVEILDVASFACLRQRFPARVMSQLRTWHLSTGKLTRHAEWELWYAPHDDAGYWYTAQLNNDEVHVVAAGEWVYGVNQYAQAWAGHIVIPAMAWREICRSR